MKKIIICDYWKNKTCKFMKDSDNCMYAHGVEDLNVVECKYGSKCNNINCLFDHGESIAQSTIVNMVYDFPIIDKRKNKIKCKKLMKKENNINMDILNHNTMINSVYCVNNKKPEKSNVVKIINKEKNINEIIMIFNTDYNNLLSTIDDFYINKYNTMINDKNKIISMVVRNNYRTIVSLRNINKNKDLLISKLKKENILLKENNGKKCYTKNNMVYQNKIISLYDKYINIFNIFNKYKNYKLINFDEIKKYTKDKNIYKLKQRSTKVYNFYENFKNGNVKNLLPVSTIFKMVF